MAAVFYKKNEAGSVVAVWKIDETEEELMNFLPKNEKIISIVNNFQNKTRKMEWLASRALIYKYTGVVPIVEYSEIGQPYISGLNKNISITHTKGYAAMTATALQKDEREKGKKGERAKAGVDIEIPNGRILRVSERFINPKERVYIPHGKEIEYCTLIWCAKETLFKMIKRQGIIFNEELIVMPFKIENEGVLHAIDLHEPKSEYILSYITTPNFYLVWHY